MKTIAIVAGGDSSEHDVSMRSAQGIFSFMNHDKYKVYVVEIKGTAWEAILADGKRVAVDRNYFSFSDNGKKITPDYCYITIHGTPGENGILQGYFDLIRMPYSTSDVLVESMTFNKFTLNQYLKGFGVPVSESLIVRKGQQMPSDEAIIAKVGLPCFVKPNAGGSSFGVSKVKKTEELQAAIAKAMNESDEVMIEAEMKGTEISVGCFKTKKGNVVLPATEVVSENEFFDYDAKYNGQVQEITPARLSDATTAKVRQMVSEIYDILHANGIIRIDFIITKDAEGNDKPMLMEINTTPGMTATSFIPQQVKAAGLNMGDVLSDVIENQF